MAPKSCFNQALTIGPSPVPASLLSWILFFYEMGCFMPLCHSLFMLFCLFFLCLILPFRKPKDIIRVLSSNSVSCFHLLACMLFWVSQIPLPWPYLLPFCLSPQHEHSRYQVHTSRIYLIHVSGFIGFLQVTYWLFPYKFFCQNTK